jgi:methylmalonyl-CoA mutase N-terminal domain/subunit
VVRTATEALAAVLGGTQSLHTNSLDETLALPSEFAATLALRTQQIIAEETGVTNTIDPLGGSYFVEALTRQVEEQAWEYIERIDKMGGMLAAIEKGYPQDEIANAAYHYQQQLETGNKVQVGVNKYSTQEQVYPPLLEIPEELEEEQIRRTQEVRRTRDSRAVASALGELRHTSTTGENVMPSVIEAVRTCATEQEICDVWREVFGEYRETTAHL